MISVDGFNLDVDNVKELKAETDQKGALFGYSLAFYRDDQNRYFKIKFTILKVRSLTIYVCCLFINYMLFGLSVGIDTFLPKILLHESSKQNMFPK